MMWYPSGGVMHAYIISQAPPCVVELLGFY